MYYSYHLSIYVGENMVQTVYKENDDKGFSKTLGKGAEIDRILKEINEEDKNKNKWYN